jgi:hypothetical protein
MKKEEKIDKIKGLMKKMIYFEDNNKKQIVSSSWSENKREIRRQ